MAKRFIPLAMLALTMIASGCAVDGLDDETDDEEVASEADALATGSLRRNTDVESVVVWSQNVRKRMENWKNVVRCMGDKACNGLGAVPDIILLEEAGCADTEAIRKQLGKKVAQGGLGITGWKKYCVDNYRQSSGHWLSNGIVFRSDRFELALATAEPFLTGNGASCTDQGMKLPIVKLFDRKRANAKEGYLEKHVTLAVRHDDHFGGDEGKDTCETRDDDTKFCTWKNSKIIDRTMRSIGGGLHIMAGDWNYAAKYCKDDDGVATTSFKHAYRCSTKGLADECDGGKTPNLGWRDPILEADPKAYDDKKVIDFIHAKDTRGFVLNRTDKNAEPGVIDKCFYCTTKGADPQRMTDHDGRLMRIRY
jgi:hypothetical protein